MKKRSKKTPQKPGPRKPALKPQPPADNEDLLDLEQAVAMLKTTRPTFYRWLRSGKFKGMKVGRQWRFFKEDLERFLKGQEPRIELAADISPLLESLSGQLRADSKEPAVAADPEPTRKALDLVLLLAVNLRASDVHLAPNFKDAGRASAASLRFRIDGKLLEKAEFDLRLLAPLVDRLKVMAGCDRHEKAKSQDGRIILEIRGRQVDLRVNFLPSALGEAVTLRILDPAESGALLALDRIPMSQGDLGKLKKWLASPWGLLAVTGPTGCGKTTTLYAGLQHVSGPGIKTITIEDPVEYLFPWMTQVQVNSAAGLDFSAAMRAMLRSDPDVVMVGELRDREAARLAQQTALTGHLVLTSMHASTAARALLRLADVGGDALMTGEAVKFVLAQRLVRMLCPHCSVERRPSQAALDRASEVARRGGVPPETLPTGFRGPVGCDRCGRVGYRGRGIITEGLEVTHGIARALMRDASEAEIESLAVGQGMTTIAADGILRAAEGRTSLEEVFRVMGLHEVQ